jgi:hypothetical protein
MFSSCENTTVNNNVPTCINVKIEEFKNGPVLNPPTEIWQWDVNGQTFYYITSTCCDQYNYLYNANCDIVCAPDGGIIGNGDGKCPEFSSEVTKTLLWKDNRR